MSLTEKNGKLFVEGGSSGVWGWHATELAIRCPQLFAYHHRIKPSPFDGGSRAPLLKGSLVHAGLAQHYAQMQARQLGEPSHLIATPTEGIEAEAEALGADAKQFVPMAKSCLLDYAAFWAAERVEVLHVEDIFKADIGSHAFTQRLDLIVREQTGKVVVIDHKTTGRFDSKTVTRYTLSGQFLGMGHFGRSVWGEEFGGVKVNAIELRQDGSFNFQRVSLDPAPAAQNGFPLTILHARERIAALDASGLDPWDWPKALSEQTCVTPYGLCDAFDLCRWGKP